MLGYGVPAEHFWRGIESGVDAMIVDSGSTDPGPYLLGLGQTIVPRDAYIRDVSLMLKAAAERKIPLIITSAGGAGTDAQVDEMICIIRETSAAHGYRFKLAAIYSSIDRCSVGFAEPLSRRCTTVLLADGHLSMSMAKRCDVCMPSFKLLSSILACPARCC